MSEVVHEQAETLFDMPMPPTRGGGRDYLSRLSALRYRDEVWPDGWMFWALAPTERSWLKPAPVVTVEHVWLIYVAERKLYQALVNVADGEILRRRLYQPNDVVMGDGAAGDMGAGRQT
jgi:hypothetical protein